MHFIMSMSKRVVRDLIYDLVARNRYRWFGPSRRLHPAEFGSFVAVVNRPETAGRWRRALVGCGQWRWGRSS